VQVAQAFRFTADALHAFSADQRLVILNCDEVPGVHGSCPAPSTGGSWRRSPEWLG
jgi:hypothetical protein